MSGVDEAVLGGQHGVGERGAVAQEHLAEGHRTLDLKEGRSDVFEKEGQPPTQGRGHAREGERGGISRDRNMAEENFFAKCTTRWAVVWSAFLVIELLGFSKKNQKI